MINLKPNYIDFKKEINEREIEYLIHFTPVINLLSMFEQEKILSRALLEQYDVYQTDILDFIEFTDEIRFDDKNYINTSISHPNSYLLKKFREKTADEPHIYWCILKINPKFIYKDSTLFSVTNAANSYNKNITKVTGDIDKFRMLFDNEIKVVTSYNSRIIIRDKLKNKYPTDEQAEVLIANEIPISDIIEVCFENEEDMASAKAALAEFNTDNFKVDNLLFSNNRN
ncbi:DUF4433 domain-containing protein [Empedobacter falsenii]|uniref:DUF4433 domain-containing protein n=1 Tax=Empedobacter TaxID=59734 RepID=UPI00214B7EC5|nr:MULTISPECIES: DUF4433 domain-containing protein [Empedobacter]